MQELKKLLEDNAPYNAKVTFEGGGSATGWNAPSTVDWFENALNDASQSFFGAPCGTAGTGDGNYLRFQLSPTSTIALAARVKRFGDEFIGDQRELVFVDAQPGEETPYERLLGDAMRGNGALFTREDAVEAAWAAVDPILKRPPAPHRYRRGTWGPKQADRLIAGHGRWVIPGAKEIQR